MESKTINDNICLAVLPLRALSEDPKIEMFCLGQVMDLITDLSRFRSFRIIACETAKDLHPNEKPDSPKLDDLNLDYLVKGMARHQYEKLLFNLSRKSTNQSPIGKAPQSISQKY